METFEGRRRHTFEISLELMQEKRLDLAALITHRFRLEDYRQALLAAHGKANSGAVKVVFDYEMAGE
jgi:threonine dehydrogenase-like Zn-dependent dehydrogenase